MKIFKKKTWLFKPYYYISSDSKIMKDGYSLKGKYLNKEYKIIACIYKKANKEFIKQLQLDYPDIWKYVWYFPGKII